jgi:hypothetical protein
MLEKPLNQRKNATVTEKFSTNGGREWQRVGDIVKLFLVLNHQC